MCNCSKQKTCLHLPTMELENQQAPSLDDATKAKWYRVVFELKKLFGKKPDMNGLLYIIGMRELGQNRKFEKEEKVDLMHIATCKLLSYDGYYAFDSIDEEGWPHYNLLKKIPFTDLATQENYLKELIVKYFENEGLFENED